MSILTTFFIPLFFIFILFFIYLINFDNDLPIDPDLTSGNMFSRKNK